MKFKAILETKGRDTGNIHRVWLLAVKYEGNLYFSRRNTNSDWLKNAQKNPDVRIEFDGQSFAGRASLVSDDCLLYTSPSPRDVEESRMPSSA